MARGYGYGPAAGAKGGAAPRLARVHVPDFLRYAGGELEILVNVLRDPLARSVYELLQIGSVFQTGECCTTYAHLIDMCTPPAPERGRRRPGPTYKQLRRAIDDLVGVGLAVRADTNEAQGQLRVFVAPRKPSSTPSKLSQTGRTELRKLQSVGASIAKAGRVKGRGDGQPPTEEKLRA